MLKFKKCNFCDVPSGKMSNFLAEDFDAVLKFMDAEKSKKKLKLK
jgi:hypothetical protein